MFPVRATIIATVAAAAVCIAAAASAFDIKLNPFSAIKNAVEKAAEDRSAADIAKDLALKTKITAEVVDKLGTEVISISSDVYEQDVMLTGSVIETKIKALLLEASGVSLTNFRWRTVGGHVFLFGRALSQAEREKATTVVAYIDNVEAVINRAKVRAKPK